MLLWTRWLSFFPSTPYPTPTWLESYTRKWGQKQEEADSTGLDTDLREEQGLTLSTIFSVGTDHSTRVRSVGGTHKYLVPAMCQLRVLGSDGREIPAPRALCSRVQGVLLERDGIHT